MGTRNRVGIGLLYRPARARICKPFKEPRIDSQPGGRVRQPYLLYLLARLHRLAESIPRNRFLGSKRLQIRAQATLASGIGSLESIPGLLQRLQIRAQATLASGIGSLELIPGLLKRLQIRAQAALASGIGSLESIPQLHNMKNEDEKDFFLSKRIYSSLNYQRDEE
jgi:hypothetical protein